jgi:hypothetical protein
MAMALFIGNISQQPGELPSFPESFRPKIGSDWGLDEIVLP